METPSEAPTRSALTGPVESDVKSTSEAEADAEIQVDDCLTPGEMTSSAKILAKPRRASAPEIVPPRRPRHLCPLGADLPTFTPRPPSRPNFRKRPQSERRKNWASDTCGTCIADPAKKDTSPEPAFSFSQASTVASSRAQTRTHSLSSSRPWSRDSSRDFVPNFEIDGLGMGGQRSRASPLMCNEVGATAWSLVFAAREDASFEERRDDVREKSRDLLRKRRGSLEASELTAQLENMMSQSPKRRSPLESPQPSPLEQRADALAAAVLGPPLWAVRRPVTSDALPRRLTPLAPNTAR